MVKNGKSGLSASNLIELSPYCAPRQLELLTAWVEEGTAEGAARRLGVSKSCVLNCKSRVVAKRNHRGDFDRPTALAMEERPLPEGFVLRGQSVLVGPDGKLRERWDKTRQEGADPDEVPKLPDAVLRRVAKFHDADGRVLNYWTTEDRDQAKQAVAWEDFARALAEESEAKWEPLPAGSREPVSDRLMPMYLVGDHHIGMLAWGEETDGPSYNTKIAERLLKAAVDHLVTVTPSSELACVAFLGDLMHYDGLTAETPTSHHRLDPDTRYGKVVRATIRCVRHVIGRTLERHERVRIVIKPGNHDPSSMIFLTELLANFYEQEPRVEVDTSPSLYSYLTHGRCLLGFHHGHQKKKLKDLPLIMATDRAELWGRSEYRYWWTGHVHHDQVLGDANGACRVESVRVLTPLDAYAHGAGFRSSREMKAVVYHADYGEMARYTVNPEMIDHD